MLEIVSRSAGNQLVPDLIRAASAENALDYPPCWGSPIDSSYEMRVWIREQAVRYRGVYRIAMASVLRRMRIVI